MAATQGHTQSLHTNAFDEALALPSEQSARIARNTQLFLIEETGTCRVVDPWGGSHHVEHRTYELVQQGKAHIREIEEAGGMISAIERGIPKLRIEEAAARAQAAIDSGKRVLVGVNRYRPNVEEKIDVLQVDNQRVRRAQLGRLEQLRRERDGASVERALAALTESARTGAGNLLELSVSAARAGATVGEITEALEREFGRYRATHRLASGTYARALTGDELTDRVRRRAAEFARREGRQPRILVTKLGQDGHDRGQRVVASAYADLGFDVDVGPLFQTPEEAAHAAVESDVHVVGVSTLAAGHLTLVPALREALADLGRDDILIVVGGVVPQHDYAALYQIGVCAIYGPGTVIGEAALDLLGRLERHLGFAAPDP
jgi:methylmalonyl-CoA mutase